MDYIDSQETEPRFQIRRDTAEVCILLTYQGKVLTRTAPHGKDAGSSEVVFYYLSDVPTANGNIVNCGRQIGFLLQATCLPRLISTQVRVSEDDEAHAYTQSFVFLLDLPEKEIPYQFAPEIRASTQSEELTQWFEGGRPVEIITPSGQARASAQVFYTASKKPQVITVFPADSTPTVS